MKNPEFKQSPTHLLKKIDAQWKAKLGPLYGKFFVAPGVRWPSEFSEDGVWQPLPPKKPAESVRFASEGAQLKKAIGAEWQFRAESNRVTGPSSMAATASAYPNSGESQSAKKRDFLSRTDIAEMLDRADFSCDRQTSKGRRNYRRRHLAAALKGIWRAASNPYGPGELLCFASVEGYAIEAGVSERALRYNLRELERIGVLQLVYAANTLRRPATYRLNLAVLRRRRTYDEVKKSRPPRRALHSIHHSSPSPPPTQSAPVAAPTPIAAASAPVPVAVPAPELPRESHRSSSRKTRQLTSREGAKLVQKMVELMRGCEGHTEVGGYYVDYLRDPENPDPRYRAPMTRDKALIAACMQFCIPEDSAREALKLAGWKFEDPETSS